MATDDRFGQFDLQDFAETAPLQSKYFNIPVSNSPVPEPHASHSYIGALHDPSPVPAAVPAKSQSETTSKRKRKEPREKKERAKRKPSAKKAAAQLDLPQGPVVMHHLGNAGGGLGGFNQNQPRSRTEGMLLDPNDWLEASNEGWDHARAAAAYAAVARNSSSNRRALPLPDAHTLCAPEIDLSTLSSEQRYALDLAMSGKSFFFTGPGGTGKSYLLKVIVSQMLRKFHYKGVYVTASTGVAACNINGQTLHSWAGLGLAEAPVERLVAVLLRDVRKAKNKIRWLDAHVLIIDEVSMLPGDFLEKLDKVGRQIRNNDAPFGGIQLILAGDFLQLPPVKNPLWCFETRTWREAITETVQLTHVFRQSDKEFVTLLNEVRFGQVSADTRHKLNACVGREKPKDERFKPTRLFPHKSSVDQQNEVEYAKLAGEEYTYKSRDWGSYEHPDVLANLQRDCQAAETIKLRIGTQVMLLKNLAVEGGLFNGARGVVVGFVQEKIVVDGNEQVTEQRLPVVEWVSSGRTTVTFADFAVEVSGQVLASRCQLPLTQAWALSIHKSQGSTLDCVEVQLDNTFEYGQSYVALSRVRSLEGLYIIKIDYKKIMAHPKALAFYRSLPSVTIYSPRRPAAAWHLCLGGDTAAMIEEKEKPQVLVSPVSASVSVPAVPFPSPAFAAAQAALQHSRIPPAVASTPTAAAYVPSLVSIASSQSYIDAAPALVSHHHPPPAASHSLLPAVLPSQPVVMQSQPTHLSSRPAPTVSLPTSQPQPLLQRPTFEVSSFKSNSAVKPLSAAQSLRPMPLPPPPTVPVNTVARPVALPPPPPLLSSPSLATLPPSRPAPVSVVSQPSVQSVAAAPSTPLLEPDVIVITDSPVADAPQRRVDFDLEIDSPPPHVPPIVQAAAQPQASAPHPPAAPEAAAEVRHVYHVQPTFRHAVSEALTPVTPPPVTPASVKRAEKMQPRVLDMSDAFSVHSVGGTDSVRVLDLTQVNDVVEASYTSQPVVFPSV